MEQPIIIYNHKKFYDLDEAENYLFKLSLSERKHFKKYVNDKINESIELYEMAYSRQEYIKECIRMSEPIHYTIANIICLEDICPEIINHWKNELLAFTKKILNTPTQKNVKRTQLLIECLITGYTDHYKNGYTYLDSIIYEEAMEDEIRKANRYSATNAQKRTANYIKTNILPNIDDFVEPNKDRVYKLFNGLIKACDKSDISIFNESLNNFILNE